MKKQEPIRVTFFFRKPQPQYHSIERVFNRILDHLPKKIEPKKYTLKNGDRGWWSKIKAIYEVRKERGPMNHITGDITYVALGLPKRGLVVTFHDLESLERKNRIVSFVLKWIWVIMPARKAEIVTVISEHTKQQIVKWAGISEKKIRVIHNPLPDGFEYTKKIFNNEKPVILCIGTKSNKNLEGTIEAVKNVNCRLIILGHLQSNQIDMLRRYSINYENLFGISDQKMIEVYQNCDILCFPSFYEGFGMPIIEAQATGRVVISSDFGAMKEVAGEGALLVKPNSVEELKGAIDELINDKGLRIRLIQKGVGNAAKYKVENTVDKFVELYKNLS
ncbi:MAG: glycosyltransferase family 4 protein [Marinilabiliaceae bacterium]|nr:glycosyltransferase family 4 protein [Marinilabiliaceae bacterium]